MSRRARLLALLTAAALAVAGCGADDRGGPPSVSGGPGPSSATSSSTPDPATATTEERPSADPGAPSPGGADGADPEARTAPAPPADWTATCPTKTPSPMGCRAVRGRVLAIQSYDPDGDGDLHVIAVGGDVTTPGVTVFDVRPSLRPERDPVKGEYVTGAGPVFRGSLGQRQIQVDVFRVWRPGR